ncbi:MAG: hypothetical protein ABGX16_09985 [Pirellulales bacterium]
MSPSNQINRCHFLAATVSTPLFGSSNIHASAAAVQTRKSRIMIDRIEVFSMRYPTFGHFKFFTGPHGSRGRAAVIVKIVADDGSVGWGQSVPIALWSYETLKPPRLSYEIISRQR